MKKRKWHKITAALATVAVILSSPGITDLVKGSSTEFVDMVPISEETIPVSENEENISRATEDFSDTTEDFSDTTEDFFETTEEPEENFGSETAAEEGSENNEADSVDCIEDFSCEDTSNTENVSPDSASAVTVLQKADETENTELAQGEVHKAKISSSVPEGQEAAKVRLYLTDAQNENPVTDLKITLSSGESTQEISEDPVQLPEALNQNEPLTVTPVTEYQLDEDGDYVFDEDGNYQIAACYLEYEVPSGGSTAFEASFTYTTDAEEYDFQAKLRVRMFREPEGTGEEISLNEEESRLTLIWNSQAEQETEDDALVEMEELAAEDVGESRPLKAGDWLFLDVEQTTSWKLDNAQVSIRYGVSGQSWNKKSMTKGNDGRFRIKLTEEIVGTNNSFKFTLDNANGGNNAIWMPNGNNLSFTQNNGSNLYIANGDDNGAWGNKWYDPLNDHTFFAGKTMYFENNTEEPLNAVNAVFYEKNTEGNLQQVGQPVEMTAIQMTAIQKGFSVTIPTEACSYVQFQDASEKVLGDTYSNFYGQGAGEDGVESVLFAAGSMDCYKYAGTPEESTWGVLGERTVYYDATLSKMSYAGSSGNDGKGIPCDSNSKVYYYATKENGKDPVYGEMTPVKDSDLWSVSLSGVYTKIRFAGYEVENATTSENGNGTDLVDIPGNLKNPCYFGDDSDDVIYKGGNRGGYWGEKGSVRDAESGKNTTVVNVPEGTFTRDSNTLYVDTTLYDYYTDYELNGQNRDAYDLVDIASHRIYQPFRQFNQALSTYYEQNNVTYPLYWGNFQNFTGSHYSEIAGTLNLYGYSENEKNKFFYENNSMWDSNGQKIEQEGQNATQGLSGAQLASGSLTLAGGAIAPFFNEDFLKGNNSKHTVLGNVYHNVTFPFIKKALTSSADTSKEGTVDYWCFDSADQSNSNKNLRLKYDSSNGYFLQSTNYIVRGQTVGNGHPATAVGNYFPLNSSSESGKACRLNYGFGQKLQLKFRLTQDGTVTTTSNKEVPIEFNFSGDDDVWVFIDDQLVLDVGGDHDVVSGRINFRDKNAWVSKVKNQSVGGFKNDKTTDFPESLKNDSDFYKKEHTLTMFYMERGLWESNMKVTFNFPDENQLQVEKQLDTTDVNELFKGLFEGTDLFDFKIKNLATHYGEKAASATTTAPVKISDLAYKVAPVPDTGNIFEKASNEGFKDSVHWYAKEQDVESTCRSQRYGELTLNDPLDISNMQYLKFKFYYDYDDTPSLSNMYLQLEDSSGNTAGCLDKETLSGRTYGTVSVASKKWITVKLDLTKLSGIKGFGNLKKIRFGYNYPRDIYLKNFIFRPTAELTASTGFATKQYDIADYGSAKSGKLENPKGAVYTSSAKSGAYAIEDDGSFVLRDKETITFRDQFRRGSYIYLKEKVDPNLFDTTWTMLENGQPVTSMGTGETVTNGSDVSSLNKLTGLGLSVNDGRTENRVSTDAEGMNPQDHNNYNGTKPSEDTFVFRSYANPDDTTTLTKLKAVFYNKVKTGSLTIKKKAAYPTDQLDGTYKFKLTFTNVGGAGLETKPIEVPEISLAANESYTITGIPIGTFFTIEEITPTDGSTLESIWLNEVRQEAGTTVLHGDINTTKPQAEVVFKNTKKPKVNLSVEKLWKTETYTGTLPDKIYVQLQRWSSDTAAWEAVKYNNSSYTELTYNSYTRKWETSFKNLDKFVDYTQSPQVARQYRIVEVTLTKDADGKVTKVTPVENGGCIEFTDAGMFKVSYDYANTNSDSGISIGEDNNGSATITNTYQPLTSIQILKIKAGTSGENQVKLGGAEFKLEKLTADGIIDPAFTVQTVETCDIIGNEEFGSAKFENLEDGTYQITETKAPEGYNPETKALERYNLLKSPIKVVINRRENFITVDRDPKNYIGSLKNNTLTIQVANQAKFQLPATGSWSRLILGFTGAIIAGTAVIMYLLLQKRRKEGKTS